MGTPTQIYPACGTSPNYGSSSERTESNDGRGAIRATCFSCPRLQAASSPAKEPWELCEYFIKEPHGRGLGGGHCCAGSAQPPFPALNTGRRFICFENPPFSTAPHPSRIEQAAGPAERRERKVIYRQSIHHLADPPWPLYSKRVQGRLKIITPHGDLRNSCAYPPIMRSRKRAFFWRAHVPSTSEALRDSPHGASSITVAFRVSEKEYSQKAECWFYGFGF
jgi:hypothetical protein